MLIILGFDLISERNYNLKITPLPDLKIQMIITDLDLLKKFSKEWASLFSIGDIHAQDLYGRPLDRAWVEDSIREEKASGNLDAVSKMTKFLLKYFPTGSEIYDVRAYGELIYDFKPKFHPKRDL